MLATTLDALFMGLPLADWITDHLMHIEPIADEDAKDTDASEGGE